MHTPSLPVLWPPPQLDPLPGTSRLPSIQEEEDDGEVAAKQEPTPWAELDPRNMKVAELKQELELRALSNKGRHGFPRCRDS